MIVKEKVLEFLERDERFRERSNKNKGIAILLQGMYPPLKEINLTLLTEILKNHSTMDRDWRDILEEKPRLQGSDYSDKDSLEVKEQKRLGYNVKS